MKTIDHKKFFDGYRKAFTRLEQEQVDGLEFFITCLEGDHYMADPQWCAYALATTGHETNWTFQPIEENLNYSADGLLRTWPKRFTPELARAYSRKPEKIANYVYANRMGNGDEASGDGWRFRGRGDSQITGRGNYQKFSAVTGIDLVNHPELAKDPATAYRILTYGMRHGTFTGKRIGYYINDKGCNYLMARKVINSMDCAQMIAGYAEKFETILKEALS